MKHSVRSLRLLAIAFTVSLSLCAVSCRGRFRQAEGMVWNTTWHATWQGPESLSDSILSILDGIGASLNVFDTTSTVSRVNRNEAMTVDPHFITVYNASRKIHESSGGLFDPTVSPLVKAWGFGPGHTLSADTAAVDSMLRFVGLHRTSLRGSLLVKRDVRTSFNFSAVAKGYACDEIGAMFRRNGVENYLMEIGGEIALNGNGPKGGGWKVSVDMPVMSATEEIHDAYTVIRLDGGGMATSGNYRNFHTAAGKTFGHTVSPITGRPVATDVLSATVIAPTAMEADALATACMAAGSAGAIAMLKKEGADALLILADSTCWKSPGFEKLETE